ncbi:MAG: molecular chaperone [Geminicoccaceae bacterium]|nr:molecular chaperone [Geminicoccaceae bacterium]
MPPLPPKLRPGTSWRAVLALLLALAGVPAAAAAAALSVSPTRLALKPTDRSGSVFVANASDGPAMIQVQGFAWKDSPSIADLEPTRALLAVPAVATLGPGERQVVRVALREPHQSGVEAAYRLVISEVPPLAAARSGGIVIAVSFSLPVFVTPPTAAPNPRFTLDRSGGSPALVAANRGSAHLHLRTLKLVDAASGKTLQEIDGGAYVLPGRSHAWPLEPGVLGRPLRVEALTGQGPLKLDVVAR